MSKQITRELFMKVVNLLSSNFDCTVSDALATANEICDMFEEWVEEDSRPVDPERYEAALKKHLDEHRSFLQSTQNITQLNSVPCSAPENHDIIEYQCIKSHTIWHDRGEYVMPKWTKIHHSEDGWRFYLPGMGTWHLPGNKVVWSHYTPSNIDI
jgi:hypothetical protein